MKTHRIFDQSSKVLAVFPFPFEILEDAMVVLFGDEHCQFGSFLFKFIVDLFELSSQLSELISLLPFLGFPFGLKFVVALLVFLHFGEHSGDHAGQIAP